ncbi:hypothetical protein ACFQY0_19480 [Haloferula chungangensis]|uniref:Uncharacterized protein n=1 Tax=Haloferula chungangensis TaxID=1048331 RepID=A0ABW2LCI7_9BACT
MDAQILSVALEVKASRQWRASWKLWAASLLRDGEIAIGRSFPEAFFPVPREGLGEVELQTRAEIMGGGDSDLRVAGRARLHQFARENSRPASWVVLADADCLALRNLDHLLIDEGELLVARSGIGYDPGFVAVSGERLGEYLDMVEVLELNGVVSSGKFAVAEFERGEVLRAGDPGVTVEDLANAAVMHFGGPSRR